jgi:hypothetical protein
MHHTRGLFFFQDGANPSNRNAAPLVIHATQPLHHRLCKETRSSMGVEEELFKLDLLETLKRTLKQEYL